MTTAIASFLEERIARVKNGDRCAKVFDGHYTIENLKTGQYRTFRINTVRNPDSGLASKRIVGLLSGPQNTADYTGFAFIDDDGISVWKRLRGEGGERSLYEVYASMLWSLATEDDQAEVWKRKGAELTVEGRCMICGRVLTVPASKKLGIGPICLDKGVG